MGLEALRASCNVQHRDADKVLARRVRHLLHVRQKAGVHVFGAIVIVRIEADTNAS